MDSAAKSKDSRSLGDIVQDLLKDFSQLFQKEVELAKTEIQEKASRTAKDSSKLVAGALITYTGIVFLLIALVLFLNQFVDLWVSALVVGAGVALVGGVLLSTGFNDLKTITLVPEQTLKTLKKDSQFIKEKLANG